MRVAIIQQQVERARKKVNFDRVEHLVQQAMVNSPPPDLIILPELWSTGYALKELAQLASSEGEEEAIFLGKLAKKNNVWFAGGSVAAKTEAGIVNRAQIINREGDLKQVYDKVHLVPMLDEDKYLIAGSSSCIYTIEDMVFGFAICYDIRFCEFIHKLAVDGAQAIIVSAQWPRVRINHWKTLLKARAIENQCYVLAANNMAGGSVPFAGASMACTPDGETAIDLGDREGVAQVHIDTQRVETIRQQIPVFHDRRPELY